MTRMKNTGCNSVENDPSGTEGTVTKSHTRQLQRSARFSCGCPPRPKPGHEEVEGNSEQEPAALGSCEDPLRTKIAPFLHKRHNCGGHTERDDILSPNDHDKGRTSVMSHRLDRAARTQTALVSELAGGGEERYNFLSGSRDEGSDQQKDNHFRLWGSSDRDRSD